MASKERIAYWDNLKLVLIYLVVVGHFLIPISNKTGTVNATFQWIYFFHMPAFVFVSGFFSKSFVKREDQRVNKLAGYILLYFIYFFALYFLEIAVLNAGRTLTLFSTKSAPWYMLAMAAWLIIIPYFKDLNPYVGITVAIIFGLLIGTDNATCNAPTIARIIILLPFFVAGYYFNGERIKNIKIWMRLLAVIILIAIFLLIFYNTQEVNKYMGFFYSERSYLSMGKGNIKGIELRMIFYIVASLMTACVMCLIPSKRNILTVIGERSLSVFVIHRLLRAFFVKYNFYKHIGGGKKALLIVLIISLIISAFSSIKVFNEGLKKIIGIKIVNKKS
ncbi:MAG: hypothetical protein E7254_05335 [Lachnospiraceae bacterium]|nr:hypothetical protein [Lachnospiraceae bacterium]